MRAVRVLAYGGQLVFNDVPAPTIARDEILVRIQSTAGLPSSFSLTFTTPGRFEYWCLIHAEVGQRGTIVVR